MRLNEQIYSVLIVSASEQINRALSEIFPISAYSPVNFVSNISAAKRAVSERNFDIIVVNSPLRDDVGIRFSVDLADSGNSIVLFLAKAEQYNDIYEELIRQGVFLLQKPVSKSILAISSDWLVSAREMIRKNEKKALSIEEKMKEIRLVNRAKWLLISELKMTEPDAHRYIEKQAMDRCVSRLRIAEDIIQTYG